MKMVDESELPRQAVTALPGHQRNMQPLSAEPQGKLTVIPCIPIHLQ